MSDYASFYSGLSIRLLDGVETLTDRVNVLAALYEQQDIVDTWDNALGLLCLSLGAVAVVQSVLVQGLVSQALGLEAPDEPSQFDD